MPVDTLLAASMELLILGMGAVFIILGLLIGCMSLLGHFTRRFAPQQEPGASPAYHSRMEAPLIAAIQSAIHMYRIRYPEQ